MPTNRELAAAFGVLSVALLLLLLSILLTAGLAVGLPASAIWIAFVANLLVLIFTPAVMSKARWTALGAVIVGVIAILAGILDLVVLYGSMAVIGAIVAIVLALLFTYFSFRAYKQK